MRKYKLIKNYPGLLEKGCVATLGLHGLSGECYGVKEPNKNIYRFDKETIENNPEFWEEVVEKDYEILSFKRASGNYEGVIFTKTNQNTFNPFFRESNLTEEHCLKNDFVIHSIKRLSDGEVFTIGDLVKGSQEPFKITSFEIIKSSLIASSKTSVHHCHVTSKINLNTLIQHVKQPLFTTEDGVDIFEGDKYYSVLISDLTFQGTFTSESPNCGKFTNPNTCKTFSTKEAAEEYIILNKPCLSINDIKFLRTNNDRGCIIVNQINLKELVKSKHKYKS